MYDPKAGGSPQETRPNRNNSLIAMIPESIARENIVIPVLRERFASLSDLPAPFPAGIFQRICDSFPLLRYWRGIITYPTLEGIRSASCLKMSSNMRPYPMG